LLDTNIILYYMRREAEKTQIIDRLYAPFASQNKVFLSIVTVAELYAIAMRHQWGVPIVGIRLPRFCAKWW
jgi:predicted nucleic acid-binding protein